MLRPAIFIFSACLAVAGLTALGNSVQQTIIQNNDEPENVIAAASKSETLVDQAATALLAGRGNGASLDTSAYFLDLSVRSSDDRKALIGVLRRAIETRPTNFYLWARLTRQELALGHYAESGAAYKMALRTGKNLPSATEWLIETGHDNWFYLNEDERAVINAKVRALFAESPDAVAGLAYTDWRLGMMQDAFEDAEARALFLRRRALMHDPALRREQRLPRS